jgi:hypothetical protein
MKKLYLLIILSILIKSLTGQSHFECFTHVPTSLKSATCNDWNNYAAVNPNNTPIKTVRITFHIMQKTNGTGNFPDNTTSRNWLSVNLMNAINSKMGSLQPMNLPSSSPTITDCRVRFTLANIYFWQDDYGWAFQQTLSFGNYLYTNFVLNKSNVSNKDNSVHIFMSENATGKGIASDVGDKSWISLAGVYANYLSNNSWDPASMTSHELGHSLGLYHTWNLGDYCNDTPYHDNCWNVNEPVGCTPLSNNLMDYNAAKNALTICQVNRMHYFLLGGEGNISDCVISGISVQNPTVVGIDQICVSGTTYSLNNQQLGVTSQWNTAPTNFFQNNTGCSNVANVVPISSSIGGEGQINFTFDWQKYGTTTVSKNLWVGKVNQLNLCSFDRNVYQADNISSPGSSCQPLTAIIGAGKTVTLIGTAVTLNGDFEVQLGGTLEVKSTGGCQ